MAGGAGSRTDTPKEQPFDCPSRSMAAQNTVVCPGANAVPDGGLQFTMTFEPSKSCARTSNCTGVVMPAHSATTLAHARTGGTEGGTMNSWKLSNPVRKGGRKGPSPNGPWMVNGWDHPRATLLFSGSSTRAQLVMVPPRLSQTLT